MPRSRVECNFHAQCRSRIMRREGNISWKTDRVAQERKKERREEGKGGKNERGKKKRKRKERGRGITSARRTKTAVEARERARSPRKREETIPLRLRKGRPAPVLNFLSSRQQGQLAFVTTNNGTVRQKLLLLKFPAATPRCYTGITPLSSLTCFDFAARFFHTRQQPGAFRIELPRCRTRSLDKRDRDFSRKREMETE